MSGRDKIEVINLQSGNWLMGLERLLVCGFLGFGAGHAADHVAVGFGVGIGLFLCIHLITRSNTGQRLWHGASTTLWGVVGFSIARSMGADAITLVVSTLIPAAIAFSVHLRWRRVADRIRTVG